MFSQIDYKTYLTELSLCRLVHAPGVGLGVLGVKNLSFWDLRRRPSTRVSTYIMHIRLNMHGVQVYIPNKKRNALLRVSLLISPFNTKMSIVIKYSFLIKSY